MQVSIESSQGLERRLKIAVPADKIESEVLQRLKKASKTASVKGFRQGKVPLKVITQYYGKGVRQEVVSEAVNSSFYQAIQQEELKPVGQPQIDDIVDNPGEDLEYRAVLEVYPEVKLADLSKVSISKPVSEITQADVDNIIEVLRDRQATFDTQDRPAEEGDQVNIDYVGTQNGEEFSGGKADRQDLVLGSETMISGFEAGLVGLSAGDETVLELKFPENYHAEDLKGKAVQFAVKVNSVAVKNLPELNDEFFKLHGVESGGEQKFREAIEANMERELHKAIRIKVKRRVMDQLFSLNTVELPEALVADEIVQLKQQMIQKFGFEQEFDTSTLPNDMFKARAERRAALGIIISEVVKVESMMPDGQQIRSRIDEIASTYEQPSEVVDHYYSKPELLSSIEALVLEDQVAELVLSKCKLKEENLSYEQAVKPDPEPEV